MNVRFPKSGPPIIETNVSERKHLRETVRILRHLEMITKEEPLANAADEIDAFLAEQESALVPVVSRLTT